MPSSKIDLTIIILNHSTLYWLKKALESIKKFYLDKTSFRVEVIVVDNHSDDESVKMVRQSFKFAQLLETSENVGFAAGNNLALKTAQNSSRYLMLLNSDTELRENSDLDQIIKLMDEQLTIGVVTPQLQLADGQVDLACHRGEPTLWASFCYLFGLENLFPSSKLFAQYHQTYKDLTTIHPVDACSGAAMIVRSSAVKKVGLLDERFFMYGEDLDWCKRFRDAGYTVLYYPLVAITHHKYKSGIKSLSGPTVNKTTKHFYDTMHQYFEKHHAKNYPAWVNRLVRYFIKIKKMQKGVE